MIILVLTREHYTTHTISMLTMRACPPDWSRGINSFTQASKCIANGNQQL